mmetsp:Transcript_11296/g.28574  ORF Transcript_11296/g.28574 Transcript_11296/m.28574 type:complete len:250 (-) Transcript_11296:192-941(-)
MYQSRSCSSISSRISGASCEATSALSVTSALLYSCACECCTCLRRTRLAASTTTGSASGASGRGGSIPMKMSSSRRMISVCLRASYPRQRAETMRAAVSGSRSSWSAPSCMIRRSRSSSTWISRMPLARCRPCLARSLIWIACNALSSDISSPAASTSSRERSGKLNWSVHVSSSFSRASMSSRSSTKKRGTGASSTVGGSLRSTSTSSKLRKLIPRLSATRASLISSTRPITAISVALMSIRFCGCTI